MPRLYNTFEFIGHISIPNDESKFHKIQESTSGWVGHRLNFAVQESKTNSVFVELYGGYFKSKANVIKTFSKRIGDEKGSNIEIPWENRLDEETIDMVADFKKTVVDLTVDKEIKEKVNNLRYKIIGLELKENITDSDKKELHKLRKELREVAPDRHEFIHNYDAVVYLASQLPVYKENKFRIRGSVDFNGYNGKFYRTFSIENIEIVDEETPSKLKSQFDIFFTKDSLDEKHLHKEKKIYIDGYVLSYDNNAKKDQFFPQQFVINATKVDFENEKQMRLLNVLKNQFTAKPKKVYHLPWEVNIFRGADIIEFTEKDLTPQQKEMVEFGLNKVEDFAPKGGLLGESIYENRLVKPLLNHFDNENDFSGGAVESTYEIDDLEFKFTTHVETEKSKQKEVITEKKPIDISDELENLFG